MQAQTVTANPTAIDFGTLHPTDFDTQTIVYTCASGPCAGAAPKITGGHTILASGNTCKSSWTDATPGQTGDTCSVSWTLKATNAEVNCPGNVCTGTVGISVTNGVTNNAVVVTDGYTATIYSAKPVVSISPTSINFGEESFDNDVAGPYPVTVTNISKVTISLTFSIVQACCDEGPAFYTTATSPVTLIPGASADIPAWLNLYNPDLCFEVGCTQHYSGTLKFWSQSITPGTPSTTYLQGHVHLFGSAYVAVE